MSTGPDADPAIPDWAIQALIKAGRRMDQRGWVPATAGNLSVRLEADRIAITRSGGHKGFLTPCQLMQMDLRARPLSPGRPSAEAPLHAQIYRTMPAAGAVLHGHSVAATVLSMALAGDAIPFQGYEVQKAFAGQATHDTAIRLPVFDNDQDIDRLAGRVAPQLGRMVAGYLIRGHGVYIWGDDMDQAMARLEALEFLLACELERARLPVLKGI